ncbi:hypothetical protein OBBRIDRAFT_791201 [Obba rivulosa]|uniref:U3 small nucleolar RNA-associated protein 6 N-terminal domain-containing protein n=1 Tax=Obba rivulosa TaxID=1052685 RepID=A0A8E2DP09_9APHY|nr:hypothetical protein OBBRIDRAFT_791201 [Obba rivulosa]
MERVQFQQEQMLAELKDLVNKGLFTQKEIKQIMLKRTAFETALVRRIPRKADFLRYAAYEMQLEALRKKRVARLKPERAPPSVSDYALVRRQFHIFERALKRFKGDIGLWVQYIQLAKKEGARALVGRITARALQLHPHVPSLYILAAAHELAHLSPASARALLQRGLRLNADSAALWREYVKMELGFVEGLRRRWGVLGIDVGARPEGKGKGREAEDVEMGDAEDGEGARERERTRIEGEAEEEGEEGERARRAIMEGAIIKSVIDSAVKALPTAELFATLHELLVTYPVPSALRESLLDHLHALLRETLPTDSQAVKLSATRHLTPDLAGPELIDRLREANERLSDAVKLAGDKERDGLAKVYVEFVEEWCAKDVDESLKTYLLTSLHLLSKHTLSASSASPTLLSAHVRLLTSYPSLHGFLPPSINSVPKILRLAQRYTSRTPESAPVWLARLDAEATLSVPSPIDGQAKEQLQRTWAEARVQVRGDGLTDVWLWGLDRADVVGVSPEEQVSTLETLLRASKHIPDASAWRTVHEALLLRHIRARPRAAGAEARLARVRQLATEFLPSARVWEAVFALEAGAGVEGAPDCAAGGESHSSEDRRKSRFGTGSTSAESTADADARVLALVYSYWRESPGAGVRAPLAYARWLLAHGRGKDATDAILRARPALDAADVAELERHWRAVVEGADEHDEEADAGSTAAAGTGEDGAGIDD